MKGKYFPLKPAIKTVHIHMHACTNAHTHNMGRRNLLKLSGGKNLE